MSAALWPIFLPTAVMKLTQGENTFNPPELNYWGKWQLITAKNWFAQALGFSAQIVECGLECQNSTIILESNKIQVPLVAITAM